MKKLPVLSCPYSLSKILLAHLRTPSVIFGGIFWSTSFAIPSRSKMKGDGDGFASDVWPSEVRSQASEAFLAWLSHRIKWTDCRTYTGYLTMGSLCVLLNENAFDVRSHNNTFDLRSFHWMSGRFKVALVCFWPTLGIPVARMLLKLVVCLCLSTSQKTLGKEAESE